MGIFHVEGCFYGPAELVMCRVLEVDVRTASVPAEYCKGGRGWDIEELVEEGQVARDCWTTESVDYNYRLAASIKGSRVVVCCTYEAGRVADNVDQARTSTKRESVWGHSVRADLDRDWVRRIVEVATVGT